MSDAKPGPFSASSTDPHQEPPRDSLLDVREELPVHRRGGSPSESPVDPRENMLPDLRQHSLVGLREELPSDSPVGLREDSTYDLPVEQRGGSPSESPVDPRENMLPDLRQHSPVGFRGDLPSDSPVGLREDSTYDSPVEQRVEQLGDLRQHLPSNLRGNLTPEAGCDPGRRELLRLASQAVLLSAMPPLAAAAATPPAALAPSAPGGAEESQNWSGTYRFHAREVLHPASPAELQQALAGNGLAGSARAVGTRHSFNGIADSTSTQISTLRLQSLELHPETRSVRAGAGLRLGELAAAIDREGWALHNLPSLPHISAGGCVSTATHGSGVHNQNLSAAVRAVEFIAPGGSAHTLAREHDPSTFPGAVVALGCLGVLTHVTFDLQPSFAVAQTVYENLPFDQLAAHLPAILSEAYSVSLFTHWEHGCAEQVWLKRRLAPGAKPPNPPATFYGATLATHKLHPAGSDPTPCTEQMNEPGPWFERLPHFKLAFTPSSGHEIQTEYFVPLDQGYAAIRAVSALAAQIAPHLIVTELRAIAADDLWLSMAYKRPSLGIHFTWKPDSEAVHALLPSIEGALAPFHPRPHWAKVFTLPARQVTGAYPRFADFHRLADQYDPQRRFRNTYLQNTLAI